MVTPTFLLVVKEYLDAAGCSPFGLWFEDLAATEAARILKLVARMEQGNLTSTKSVGDGVSEYRLDSGPGYRIYFGRDGA